MIRNICVCKDCGHKFIEFDFSVHCTAFSFVPPKCPKCGSNNTSPVVKEVFKKVYRLIRK